MEKTFELDCHVPVERDKQKGFDFFFREYYSALCFYARRFVTDRTVAEDIVTDAYVNLWRRDIDFDDAGRIRSYLYASVKNASVNEYRRRGRWDGHEKQMAYMYADEIEQCVLEKVVEKEFLFDVYNRMRMLPTQCRRIITMFYKEGKALREIAEEMGLSLSTVKNQNARGIAIIRRKLGMSQ